MTALNKQERILAILRDGTGLNRFQAERHGDHVLPSTVFALRRKGNLILDSWETVPSRFGRDVRVKRYQFVGQL